VVINEEVSKSGLDQSNVENVEEKQPSRKVSDDEFTYPGLT
jgi:hypothetical protein